MDVSQDIEQILALYDRAERIEAEFPNMRREVTSYVIRHVPLAGGEGGVVLYSRLAEDQVEPAVREQIARYEGLGVDVEWKAYSHDTPADLKDRLEALGFEPEEPEAIVVLDLARPPGKLLAPVSPHVRRILDPGQIGQVLAVQEEVWGRSEAWLAERLARDMQESPHLLSVYAAQVDGRIVSSAWLYFDPRSPFASLWGGSTLPAYRSRGLYTALLAARTQEAIARGARYLTVDASPMSRPILERLGFRLMTYAHPRHWRAATRSTGVAGVA